MKHLLLALFLLASFSLSAQEAPLDARDICPILMGTDLPNSRLKTLDDKEVSISRLTKKKPTVIIFYRGGWCPYCNKQLSGLNDLEAEISDLGFQILAISPDKPSLISETSRKNKLKYTLLSDAKMTLARKMGIAFKLDKKTLKKYKRYGIDLKEISGYDHFQLPAPAVFVVDKKGVIQFSHVNPNYSVRLQPEVLLTVLRTMPK